MEKHRCKLCRKKFSNGKALGGHMRSHMVNLPVCPKPVHHHDSISESSLSDYEDEVEEEVLQDKDDEENDDEESIMKLKYKFRMNPKKSAKLADPEFSSLQDRESETESPKINNNNKNGNSQNFTRKRSRRSIRYNSNIKSINYGRVKHRDDHDDDHHHGGEGVQVEEYNNVNKVSSSTCHDESSAVSDVTSEADLAMCLVMMSRDKWESDHVSVSLSQSHHNVSITKNKSGGGTSSSSKYKCETCNKVFKSYQALGGHRASHKKLKKAAGGAEDRESNPPEEKKVVIHECPVCFKVFGSGQALGGHKRSHGLVADGGIGFDNAINNSISQLVSVEQREKKVVVMKSENVTNFIDLNLPAPVDDEDEDEINSHQIVISAVSDARL